MSVVSAELENRICILASENSPLMSECAAILKCPVNPLRPEDYFFHLHVQDDRLLVRDGEGRKLEIDFDQNHLDYQRAGPRGKNELIAKALGLGKGVKKVLDLSVGMGIDSIFLIQLGFEVVGVERSPVLYLLLKNALARTRKEELKGFQLNFGDSLDFLKTSQETSVDAIYFDPMYPHKKKSALPKQEMVVFRDLVGDDADAAAVLAEALKWPVKRVVVKRPLRAPELLPGVRHAFEGKVVRYDTYVVG